MLSVVLLAVIFASIRERDLPDGYDVSTGALMATTTVARLTPSGHLLLPPGIQEVQIDVGTNSQGYLRPSSSRVFVLGFEPLLDKYATMLSRGTKALGHGGARSPIVPNAGWPGRVANTHMVLPYAISTGNGFADFHISEVDGCSSMQALRASNDSRYPRHVTQHCSREAELRRVPTISLHFVLQRLIPPELPVTLLRVDAQGHDLAVVQSAGRLAPRIAQARLEAYPDDCPPFYEGQPLCTQIVAGMRALGFKYTKGTVGEVDGEPRCSTAGCKYQEYDADGRAAYIRDYGECCTFELTFVRGAGVTPLFNVKA